MDKFNPEYNTLKVAGSSFGYKLTEEHKARISKSLKGVYVGEKSWKYGTPHSEATKLLISEKKKGSNNHRYGFTFSEQTKELIRAKALGRTVTEETKLKISAQKGFQVNIMEKCDSEGFKLIGCFTSARKAALFLGISPNTVRAHLNSGYIFKDRYMFKSGKKT
jgi:group I intron endonuclease